MATQDELVERYRRLKQDLASVTTAVEAAEREKAQLEGQQEALLREAGCKTLGEAQTKLADLQADFEAKVREGEEVVRAWRDATAAA